MTLCSSIFPVRSKRRPNHCNLQGVLNLKSSHPSSRPGIELDSWDSVLLLYCTDTFSITSIHDAFQTSNDMGGPVNLPINAIIARTILRLFFFLRCVKTVSIKSAVHQVLSCIVHNRFFLIGFILTSAMSDLLTQVRHGRSLEPLAYSCDEF